MSPSSGLISQQARRFLAPPRLGRPVPRVPAEKPARSAVPGIAAFGDSDALRAGEEVVAIGSALGECPNTVSQGAVNGTNRAFPGMGAPSTFVQHDAEIWHRNSGGPLLNLRGEVMGINA